MMNGKFSALFSEYVIDGVKMGMTPANLLEECMRGRKLGFEPDVVDIVDESVDPTIRTARNFPDGIDDCLKYVLEEEAEQKSCPESAGLIPSFAEKNYMKLIVAGALIDSIWHGRSEAIDSRSVSLSWRWNDKPLGNMAAFYSGVESLTRYLFDIDVAVADAKYDFVEDGNYMDVKVLVDGEMDRERLATGPLKRDGSSWLVYVPFDTAPFRLGGSLLTRACGSNGDAVQDINDPCYFSDCFEVVKELVVDGVAVAGISVGHGGLLTALRHLLDRGEGVGADISIAGIMRTYSEQDPLRILFAQMPGVVIQVMDADFDYIDSQFLLQDVAYFPIGHPVFESSDIKVIQDSTPGISSILESLADQNYKQIDF